MPKESLKDKLEGNELDLSLSNLETIPWKEMAALPKATHLDLSCNLISSIPENFCSFKHIIKLDLSKNCIKELPANFGELSNLQHLDLLGNKLHLLPVSFWQLKRLKWLDMKDNPLDEGLKKAAGDCLDDVQCKKCAQQVLAFMKAINSDIERQRQKTLQQERDKETEQKAEEETIRQRKRAEKLAEKEQRRKKYEALKKDSGSEEEHDNTHDEKTTPVHKVSEGKAPVKKGSGFGLSCCFTVINVLLMAVALCVGIYIYCDMKKIIPQCQQVVTFGDDVMAQVKTTFNSYLSLITGKRK